MIANRGRDARARAASEPSGGPERGYELASRSMRSPWLCALLLSALAAGCADETAILLEIDSTNLVIPTDVDGLRVRAVGLDSGRTTDRLFTPDEWPESLAIIPGSGSNRERVRITVWGRLGDAERVKRIVEATFVPDRTTDVRIVLDRDCLDVTCMGETNYCLGGDCVTVMPPTDGGVDMGSSDLGPDPMDMGIPVDMNGMEDDMAMADEDMGPDDMFTPPDMPDVPIDYTGFIISEYVEGDSLNKAVEVFNGTGGSLDANDCELVLFRNGGAEADSFGVDTTLADGQAWVFCHSGLADTSNCDSIESTSLNHNGNDAYALRCEGTIIDSLGDTLGDPGSEWSGGGIGTSQDTLRRVCPPTADANLGDAFDPSAQWTSAGVNVLTGLGSRSCPGSP